MVETPSAYCFIYKYYENTVEDLINFNSHLLKKSETKKAFIIYQLFDALYMLHSNGIIHGNLKMSNIFVDESLWIRIKGICFGLNNKRINQVPKQSSIKYQDNSFTDSITSVNEYESNDYFSSLVSQWTEGYISNYDYIMELNKLAGRRFGDPNFHPILPWVIDFNGDSQFSSWRDLTKSKFRINKGDEQLDLQWNDSVFPHHITNMLSDVTYYVYLARKTSVPVLKNFVRSRYKPDEYPTSIQRLYEWTPDECIPEFYTDPSIFKSIHEDMCDLQLPKWASSFEDFIKKHREALESDYVSSRIHLWINLTFGYKLTGKEAIKAKNVALPLVADDQKFMKHGIKQLFTKPHPQRIVKFIDKELYFAKYYFNRKQLLHQTFSPIEPTENLSSHPMIYLKNESQLQKTIKKLSEQGNNDILSDTPNYPYFQNNENLYIPINNLVNTCPLKIDIPDKFSNDTFLKKLDNIEKISTFSNLHISSLDKHYNKEPNQLHSTLDKLNNDKERMSYIYLMTQDIYDLCLLVLKFSLVSDKNINLFILNEYLSNKPTEEKLKILLNNIPHSLKNILHSVLLSKWNDIPLLNTIFENSRKPIVKNNSLALPYSLYISNIYKYLKEFHQISWMQRLNLTKKWIERICNLSDEMLNIVLPFVLSLYSNKETRVYALVLFEKLSLRLGPEQSKEHLLKPLLQLFDSKDKTIYKVLLSPYYVSVFHKAFSLDIFLDKLLNYYVSDILQTALFEFKKVNTEIKKAPCREILKNAYEYKQNVVDIDEIQNQNQTLLQSSCISIISVCMRVGPILTSKYITSSLLKVSLRDVMSSIWLQQSIVLIGKYFGEVFIYQQFFPILKDSLNKFKSFYLSKIQPIVLFNTLELFEQLIFHVSSSIIASEQKEISTLISSLIKYLANSNCIWSLNEKMTIFIKSFSLLLCLATVIENINDIKLYVCSIIQEYFIGVTAFIKKYSIGEVDVQSKGENAIYTDDVIFYIYEKALSVLGEDLLLEIKESSTINEYIQYKKERNERKVSQQFLTLVQDPYNSSFSAGSYDSNYIENNITSISDKIKKSSTQSLHTSYKGESSLFHSNDTKLMSKDSLSNENINSSNKYSSTRGSLTDNKEVPKEEIIENNSNNEDRYFVSKFQEKKSHKDYNGVYENKPVESLKQEINMDPVLQQFSMVSPESPITLSASISCPNISKKVYNSSHLDNTKVSGLSNFNSSSLVSLQQSNNELSKDPSFIPNSFTNKSDRFQRFFKPKMNALSDKLAWDKLLSTTCEYSKEAYNLSFQDLKLRTYSRHNARINVMAANETLGLMASGSRDRTVKIWSLDFYKDIEEENEYTGCLLTYNRHHHNISDVFFNNNLVISSDSNVHIWDSESGRNIHKYKINRKIEMIKPYNNNIIGVSSDNEIVFLDQKQRKVANNWKLPTTSLLNCDIKSLAISSENHILAVGFSNGIISIMDSRTGNILSNWKAHENEISHLSYYDKKYLISASNTDKHICLWNITDNNHLVKTIKDILETPTYSIVENNIITINNNNWITINSISDNYKLYSSKIKLRTPITSLAILKYNKFFLFGNSEGEINLYA
ncbi:hypothetical protein BCR36DRAFT_176834 [Piromyces finnis]|uniref:WD40 repeat-like protein n=1 Tax=Piromyces finnis TaxID=1754191 RepID=A0A1Y1VI62_9FUNG|nr:hypothetical protein BCR36DRAFT_176834 [Piromyces finnis]|eukprot:ORX56074.1 hypothetical protein BCR36DRAFT_176834 [Piromyces finnis]